MLNFILSWSTGELVAISDIASEDPDLTKVNRNHFSSLVDAVDIADKANKLKNGKTYIATDAGKNCSPRYDVIAAPAVGSEVSQSFNGDSYPCGKIVKVSVSLRKVTTDTGKVFWRHKQTGSWLVNGYASMIAGHVSERNPSF